MTPAVPTALAGAVTVAVLVGLGIFVYPWLLTRRFGAAVIAVATIALALLFFYFDLGRGTSTAMSIALGVLWALAPLVAGLIVRRINRGRAA
jgi:hypothetical protein